MRSLSIVFVSSLLSLIAIGTSGCGGGACADYCDASLTCATASDPTCELANRGDAQSACVDACNAGLDAVPSADDRQAIQDCLSCISPLFRDSCDYSSDVFAQCQSQCIAASSSFEVWGEAASEELSQISLTCTNGKPVGGGDCTYSGTGGGATEICSLSCTSGGVEAAGECEGADGNFTCQCTAGSEQGASFSSTCDDLEAGVIWEACNP